MNKSTLRNRNKRAVRALLDVLPRSADIRVVERDTVSKVVVGGQPVSVTWLGDGRLREVGELLADRLRLVDVVIARRFSPGARAALSEAGVGWVDETGAAEIAVESIVVSRTGRPVVPDGPPGRWTSSVVAVAEALLCGATATVTATERVTGLSTGSCINALRVLTNAGMLEADVPRGPRSGRHVSDADRLLDAYASAVDALPRPVAVQVGVTWRDPVAGLTETGRRWDGAGIAWAATGPVAGAVLAPYLTTVTTAEAYVEADTVAGLEAVAADAGSRPIEGGRLTLRPFPTVSVQRLASEVDGLRVAPWPRVYVDLFGAGVRGEEAAEHLREVMRGK